jgi:hypothetical protein
MRAAAVMAAALLLGVAGPVLAQQTHILVVTGVSGDEDHAKTFHAWATTFIDAAKTRDSVPDQNVVYLAEKKETDAARIRGRSTRENVEKAVSDMVARVKPNDAVVVLLIGHGSFDGKVGAFNLPGPDLTAADWAKVLGRFAGQRVAFINTSSSSGAFLPTVAGPGRTIITSTKTGAERNEPRFAGFFVAAFNDEAADRDRNGHVSMLEAFDYARTKVAAAYQQAGLILTEHATLDDGAEGKLAATQFLAASPGTVLNVDTRDPDMGKLVAEHDELEKKIAALRLTKDSQDPAKYEQELERLLTALAVKTKAIRDLQAVRAEK